MQELISALEKAGYVYEYKPGQKEPSTITCTVTGAIWTRTRWVPGLAVSLLANPLVECPGCDGDGEMVTTHRYTCTYCKGKGRLRSTRAEEVKKIENGWSAEMRKTLRL